MYRKNNRKNDGGRCHFRVKTIEATLYELNSVRESYRFRWSMLVEQSKIVREIVFDVPICSVMKYMEQKLEERSMQT